LNGLTPWRTYHWQCRAIDAAGAMSGWVEYTGTTASPPPPSSGGTGGGGGGGCGASIGARSGPGWLPWLLLILMVALVHGRTSPRAIKEQRTA
jgi:hypothetical protein